MSTNFKYTLSLLKKLKTSYDSIISIQYQPAIPSISIREHLVITYKLKNLDMILTGIVIL